MRQAKPVEKVSVLLILLTNVNTASQNINVLYSKVETYLRDDKSFYNYV